MKRCIEAVFAQALATTAVADINQYEDGDGTMLLTELDALSGADVSGLYLACANLSGMDLTGADLYGANLEDANLEGANLEGAYLNSAFLSGANLKVANLKYAYLEWADLDSVNLESANLSGANLVDTNLFDATSLRNALYSDDTVFPDGFDPKSHGMIYDGGCSPDADGNGVVDVIDLLAVIAH